MDKTIRMTSKGHDVSFTSKALTIDDKEFLYKNISDIKHSSAKHIYIFRCNDEWHKLEYDEKDQKKISTIFSRIAALKKAQKPAAPVAAEPAAEAPEAEQPAEAPKSEQPAAEPAAASLLDAFNENAAAPAEAPEAEAAAEEPAAEEPKAEAAAEEPAAEEPKAEAAAEEKVEEVEPEEAKVVDAEEEPKAEETAEEPKSDDEKAEVPAEETERKSRLKKSITILLIIIALFVVAGIAYFFVFGTPNDSSQSPATDSTHQYNDIDELIDEMQE